MSISFSQQLQVLCMWDRVSHHYGGATTIKEASIYHTKLPPFDNLHLKPIRVVSLGNDEAFKVL